MRTFATGSPNKGNPFYELMRFCAHGVLDQECATSGLIELMKLFPSSAYFFINSWTWGYEDILKAIAQSFQSKVFLPTFS